jgi:hypothetical protein
MDLRCREKNSSLRAWIFDVGLDLRCYSAHGRLLQATRAPATRHPYCTGGRPVARGGDAQGEEEKRLQQGTLIAPYCTGGRPVARGGDAQGGRHP